MEEDEMILVELSLDELKYVIRCGGALVVNVSEAALPTYCGFTSDEIYSFSKKMRDILDGTGHDL